ncbi:extensin-like [Homarus americanus]|uniref:extensin-like n=1 Tax=Homarus americanus TaxID=6706 RepID=UPI001C43AA4B|nr:extensin-like [Homarus americanus]
MRSVTLSGRGHHAQVGLYKTRSLSLLQQTVMNSKVYVIWCLVGVVVAHPDRPTPAGYGYSAPDHPLTYTPPPSAYKAPEPTYEAPSPSYRAPAPSYKAPEPTYEAPSPSYKAPEPTYKAPAPSYKAPEPTYEAPAPSYKAPAPSYKAPAPSYKAPAPSYKAPTPSYKAPAPSYKAPAPSYEAPSYEKGMPFDFVYNVVDHYSGNDYAHNAISDGSVVNGEYRVVLPDGRTQLVTYTADDYNGYVAEVTYEVHQLL